MIKEKRILAIIPARGGSKGLPGKNVRMLLNKPLIAWTIAAAQSSAYIDRIIVSTDDEAIRDAALHYGAEVPFMRPPGLAQDDTPGVLPVIHAIEQLPGYDYILLLQPTSPLRTTGDIDGCITTCMEAAARSCVSVVEPEKSPYWMYQMNDEGKLTPLIDRALIARRQEHPTSYALNGALYFAEINWIMEHRSLIANDTIGYIMPIERSYDIDTLHDFEICEYLLRKSVDNVDNSVHN